MKDSHRYSVPRGVSEIFYSMGSLFKGRETACSQPGVSQLAKYLCAVPDIQAWCAWRRILNASSDNGVCSGTSFDNSGNLLFSLCPLRPVCHGVQVQEAAQLTTFCSPEPRSRGPATAAASPDTFRSPAELPGMTHCTFLQNLDNPCNTFAVVVLFHPFILYFDVGVALGTATSRTFLLRHLGLVFILRVNELLNVRARVFSPSVHFLSRRR